MQREIQLSLSGLEKRAADTVPMALSQHAVNEAK